MMLFYIKILPRKIRESIHIYHCLRLEYHNKKYHQNVFLIDIQSDLKYI